MRRSGKTGTGCLLGLASVVIFGWLYARSCTVAHAAEPLKTELPAVAKGDLTIAVLAVRVGEVPYKDFSGKPQVTEKKYLSVFVGVKNGSETKKVRYQTWAARDAVPDAPGATLRDDLGNDYRRIDLGLGGVPYSGTNDASIYPGKSVTDVLVFEVPVDKAKSFTLDLPGGNVGLSGAVSLSFPMAAVR